MVIDRRPNLSPHIIITISINNVKADMDRMSVWQQGVTKQGKELI